MRKVENIQEGYYFTDGGRILEITGSLPSRPDSFTAITDDGEEIRIKRDKLYKIKLDQDWLDKLNITPEKEIYKDSSSSVKVRKSGPSFHLEIQDLKEGGVKRKMVLSVDELQHQLADISGKIYKVASF